MKYRIELAASAKADIREAVRWLRHNESAAYVDKWLARLLKTINTLESQPSRCPLAAEGDKFPLAVQATSVRLVETG